MSYILDALRRADAERERGGVPGLHTQAMPDLGDDERAVRTRGLRPWHWVVLGLAGGLAVALAWSWRGGETAPPPPPPLPPPPVARAEESVSLPPPPPPPVAVAPATEPAVAPAIAPMRATPPPAKPAEPVAAEPQRIASLSALPPELRAGLPTLSFGGSIYSNTAANRLLIVNGQLMHEGDSLGAGVTLEQIKPKAAVLNIRGQRFEVGL